MIEVDLVGCMAKKGRYLLPCISYSLTNSFNIPFIYLVSRLSRVTAIVFFKLLARLNKEQQQEDILEDIMHNIN